MLPTTQENLTYIFYHYCFLSPEFRSLIIMKTISMALPEGSEVFVLWVFFLMNASVNSFYLIRTWNNQRENKL